MKKWVCQTDRTHVFDREPAEEGWCPECPRYGGIVLEEDVAGDEEEEREREERERQEEEERQREEARQKDLRKRTNGNKPVEVGLCVILMDASSSMTELAFKGSALTRMRLIATSAASGIFDLERMQNNPNAFVAAFKFDDRVELMFVDTVARLLERYDKDVQKFANYIYDELASMQQGTDINQALRHAYDFINKFIKKQLPEFNIRNYTPMRQVIMKYNSIESVSIPNVRVLIYTDGMQYDENHDKTLLPNPFKEKPIPELNHDIVIGAFFGQQKDEGCAELRSLLSRCPIHDEEQFFLFDDPSKISILKNLFRMASGASGFCPKCLDKQLSR